MSEQIGRRRHTLFPGGLQLGDIQGLASGAGDLDAAFPCGNDLSCRGVQKRTPQWLLGKNFPGFAPCGPFVVTADSFDPNLAKSIRSYVNGELRQDGVSTDMVFKCADLISYASKYVHFRPGDLIFTGTPAGVAMEDDKPKWLKKGDVVDIEIEGLGKLTNTMK